MNIKKAMLVASGLIICSFSGVPVMATTTTTTTTTTGASITCPSTAVRKTANNYAECFVEEDTNGNDLMSVLRTVINVIVGVIGFVSVFMIILGGITFTTSQGDTAKVARGRNTILYGVIGLVIALLAFAIVNFVLNSIFSPKV